MTSKAAVTDMVRGHRAAEAAAALAAKPALMEARDKRGRTWLHLACMVPPGPGREADSIATADMLLGLGLGIDDAAFREGEWAATSLWHAIAWGRNLPLARHLIARGANPNFSLFAAAWNDDRAAIRLLVDAGAQIEERGEGDTPLTWAVRGSRFGPAEELLALGADPDALDDRGHTALHLMLRKGSDAGYFPMFVAAGARGDIPDADGKTAIEILRRKKDPAFHAIADALAIRA
jgi:hypothetical protein